MEITIHKLNYGGEGVGRVNGKVVFVKGGLPGDVLDVEIVEDKKTFSKAKINRFIKRSANRVEPNCEYFGECGGCQLQNLDYSTQLTEKEQIVFDSLSRIGGFKKFDLESIEPSSKIYEYRKRAKFSVVKKETARRLSFYKEKSNNKIPIEHCPICSTSINEAIKLQDKILNKDLSQIPIENVYIVDDEKGFSFSVESNKDKEFNHSAVSNISFVGEGESEYSFFSLDRKFVSIPSLFNQINSDINQKIIEKALEWIKPEKEMTLLDLYCGIGNFTLQVSKYVKDVIGVDNNKLAIKYAKRNAQINDVKNVSFYAKSCKEFLDSFKGKFFDTVFLDPPRQGAKEIISYFEIYKPPRVVYQSCDPTTLSRDLKKLSSIGYELKKVKPFDMFPHTYHIETLSMLELRN